MFGHCIKASAGFWTVNLEDFNVPIFFMSYFDESSDRIEFQGIINLLCLHFLRYVRIRRRNKIFDGIIFFFLYCFGNRICWFLIKETLLHVFIVLRNIRRNVLYKLVRYTMPSRGCIITIWSVLYLVSWFMIAAFFLVFRTYIHNIFVSGYMIQVLFWLQYPCSNVWPKLDVSKRPPLYKEIVELNYKNYTYIDFPTYFLVLDKDISGRIYWTKLGL